MKEVATGIIGVVLGGLVTYFGAIQMGVIKDFEAQKAAEALMADKFLRDKLIDALADDEQERFKGKTGEPGPEGSVGPPGPPRTIELVECVAPEPKYHQNAEEWKEHFHCDFHSGEPGHLELSLTGHQHTGDTRKPCIAGIYVGDTAIPRSSYTSSSLWVPSHVSGGVQIGGENVRISMRSYGTDCFTNGIRISGAFVSSR